MHTYPATELEALHTRLGRFRQQAYDLLTADGGPHQGWNLAGYDPMELVACFHRIRLEPGWRIVAWHYVAGGNGAGFAIAIADSEEQPEVPAEPRFPFAMHLLPERRASALSVLRAIDPSDPLTYIEGSLLARALLELMPMWHDVHFHGQVLVTDEPRTPLNAGVEASACWEPHAALNGDTVTVVFHTEWFDNLSRYTDSWRVEDFSLGGQFINGVEHHFSMMNAEIVGGDGARPPS